jgi:hypothetical protein
MRNFLNGIKGFPHAEERSEGASRSTHRRAAASFLTSVFASDNGFTPAVGNADGS